MRPIIQKLRATKPNRTIGFIRVMLGVVFIMTGVMKLTLPKFGAAWSVQLIEAGIPFYSFNYWFVPVFETLLGSVLLVGFYTRIGAFMILPVMLVATYVHVTVTNPAAFPAQPQDPYIPIVIIIMALVVIIKGGGSWSLDSK